MTLYNEIDKGAAEWLRRLQAVGQISAGPIDERSIADVGADDLAGALRVHFFAGIGGWDLALHLAGWPGGLPVWTGSCPCQPFSIAGKGRGTDDARHLWPEMFRLIGACRPPIIFGEQVSSPAGREWCAGVRTDLEGAGYHFDAIVLCAAGIGAPHIRERIYWGAYGLADTTCQRREGINPLRGASPSGWDEAGIPEAPRGGSAAFGLADVPSFGRGQRDADTGRGFAGGSTAGSSRSRPSDHGDITFRLGDALSKGSQGHWPGLRSGPDDRRGGRAPTAPSGPGFWDAFDILPFRDGKARRAEPGSFPLAHGLPRDLGRDQPGFRRMVRRASRNRTTRLRGYGNAIVPQLAAVFVRAFVGFLEDSGMIRKVKP